MGFGLVLEILKGGIDVLMKSKKLRTEERETLSNILSDVSQILNSTVEKFKQNEFPHSHCQTLQILAQNLQSSLKSHLDPDQTSMLMNALEDAVLVERDFALRHDPKTIQTLEIVAGTFAAWSLLVKG